MGQNVLHVNLMCDITCGGTKTIAKCHRRVRVLIGGAATRPPSCSPVALFQDASLTQEALVHFTVYL